MSRAFLTIENKDSSWISSSFRSNSFYRENDAVYFFVVISAYILLVLFDAKPLFAVVGIIINTLFCFASRSQQAALLSSFLLGNEFACVVNLLICAILSKKHIQFNLLKTKMPGGVLIILALVLMSSLLNTGALGTSINFVVECFYLAFLAFIFFLFRGMYSPVDLWRVSYGFVLLEAVSVFMSCVQYGFVPGDSNSGTFGNAHALGIWSLVVCIVGYDAMKRSESPISRGYLVSFFVAVVFCFLMSDTKAPAICGLLAVFLYCIVVLLGSKKHAATIAFVLFIVVFSSMVFLLSSPSVKNALENNGVLSSFSSTYLYDEELSIKFTYFSGTLNEEVSSGRVIYGYGLGQYGSRVSNLFGYDYMYRDDNAVNSFIANNFESKMLDEYQRYASMYTPQIHQQIGNYSALALYPFSSLMALIAETGILGIIFLAIIIDKARLSRYGGAVLLFFVGCCVMDTFFDQVVIVGFVLAYLANMSENGRVAESSSGNQTVGINHS